MGFLKKLFGGGTPSSSSDLYTFTVRCDRCGETIEGKVNLSNDLSLDDEGGYNVRKVLMGSGHCFQQIEVTLKFDASRQLQEKQISGGKFVEES
ncbi:MAG: hypothetical protein JW963_15090 [Anaerolineales bacterium]|nr:hypothetical protein [Anaerolineales bacterium]